MGGAGGSSRGCYAGWLKEGHVLVAWLVGWLTFLRGFVLKMLFFSCLVGISKRFEAAV